MPAHSGRLAALVIAPQGGLVEVRGGGDLEPPTRVNTLQAVCCCGWRSRRYVAPDECVWASGALTIPAAIEGAARTLWVRHCVEEQGAFLVEAAGGV